MAAETLQLNLVATTQKYPFISSPGITQKTAKNIFLTLMELGHRHLPITLYPISHLCLQRPSWYLMIPIIKT